MWNRSAVYTRIKLCEFESLDSAYEAAALGADALGFHIFAHHPDEKAARFADIFRLLPRTVEKTLLTDLDEDRLGRALGTARFDSIQLYPDWDAATIARVRSSAPYPFKILKVMSADFSENAIADPFEFVRSYEETADAILLDSARRGGTGHTSDWDACARIVAASRLPVFLAGGLDPMNVGAAIRRVRPFGVDVETGVSDRIEGGPLVKNMHKCRAFVDSVLRADRELLRSSITPERA